MEQVNQAKQAKQIDEIILENTVTESLLVTLPQLSGKDVGALVNMDCRLPRTLLGDEKKLSQALKNMMDYAIREVDQGNIYMHVLQNKQKSLTENDMFYVDFEVGGGGLTQGNKFDMTKTKKLVDAMNGQICIEYVFGVSLALKITIPFNETDDHSTLLQKTEAHKLKGKKILVFSEDEAMIESLEYLFYEIGMECVFVSEPDQVIEKLYRYSEKCDSFDLMLCDYASDNMAMLNIAHKYREISPQTVGMLMVATFNGNYLKSNDIIEVGSLEFIDRLVIPSEFISRMCYFMCGGSTATNDWNMDEFNFDDMDKDEFDFSDMDKDWI